MSDSTPKADRAPVGKYNLMMALDSCEKCKGTGRTDPYPSHPHLMTQPRAHVLCECVRAYPAYNITQA